MTHLLAHGIGGRQDLPLPLDHVIIGAAVAVVVSFVALGGLWRVSRFDAGTAGAPVPYPVQRLVDARALRVALRLLALAATGYVALAAIAGPDDALNPTAYVVYVLFWVGVVFASVVLGPVWKVLNPLRALHLALAWALRIDPRRGLATPPSWLGYWPAAAGLLLFTWLELAAPNRDSAHGLRTWFGLYAAVHLIAALAFGSRWFARGDAFEVYSTLVGRLSPFGRRGDGRLVVRNPLAGLAGVPAGPGLAAVVCVLFGSTAYDGGSSATFWIDFGRDSGLSPVALSTLGLLGTIAVVGATYVLACTLASRLSRRFDDRLADPPDAPAAAGGHAHLAVVFAHSLVPIVAGYVVAHYFSFLIFQGQQALILLSDPLGTGANLLGTAERGVDYSLVSGAAIALIQVVAVVAGHVLGVVSSHDRAVGLFPRARAVVGQVPLLALMVCFTVGGLSLLFAA